MVKHKSHGKDKKKSSQFVIRVDKSERDAFVALCDRLDTSAAREIRRFMRDLVAMHAGDTPLPDTKSESATIKVADGNAEKPGVAVVPELGTDTITKEAVKTEVVASGATKPKKTRAPQKASSLTMGN